MIGRHRLTRLGEDRLQRDFDIRRGRIVATIVAFAAASLAALLLPASARASGDFGCSPSWKMRHPGFTGCDSMMVLSPGNDTRVNLALLLRQEETPVAPAPKDERPSPLFDWAAFERWRYPNPPDLGTSIHAAGEGSRCLSDAEGSAAFAAAVGAARGLAAAERATLIAARRSLKPDCVGARGSTIADTPIKSRTGKSFLAYVQGAAAFYAGDFDTAAGRFTSLTSDGDPWLRETAEYMLARVEVNRAQVGAFDEYGYRDDKAAVDAKVIAVCEEKLRAYLRAYPDGHYARSARGLLRRTYWLGRDTRKLAAEYVALFSQSAAMRGLDDAALAEEIDNKLLPQLTLADTTDPVLLAVLDLKAMRRDTRDGGSQPPLTRAALEAQRARFTSDPALFQHLLATFAFYIEGNAREVLRLIPDAAGQPTKDAIQFSRQVLRGMALDATTDRNARGFWLDLLRTSDAPLEYVTVELALALHDERTGGIDRVFAATSPVRDATLRDLLLTNVAPPALLRRQAADPAAGAHERAIALFALLYKSLTRGAYRDFLADVPTVPPGLPKAQTVINAQGGYDPPLGIFVSGPTAEEFACPALRDTARRLAAEPSAATPRLCLAEFVRLHGLDEFYLDTQPPGDELGGTPSLFAGRPYSRLTTYIAVIAAPKTSASDRAYALFRAVNCYAPSGSNSCGGEGVAKATRRSWFQRLHRDYPSSRWATELEYYW